MWYNPLDTGHNLNVHKTFRRQGRLLNVLCTVNFRPVSRRKWFNENISPALFFKLQDKKQQKLFLVTKFLLHLCLNKIRQGNFQTVILVFQLCFYGTHVILMYLFYHYSSFRILCLVQNYDIPDNCNWDADLLPGNILIRESSVTHTTCLVEWKNF